MARNKRSASENNAQRAGQKRGRQAADEGEPADQPEAPHEEAANGDLNGQAVEEDARQAPDADRRAGWAAAARRYLSMPSN